MLILSVYILFLWHYVAQGYSYLIMAKSPTTRSMEGDNRKKKSWESKTTSNNPEDIKVWQTGKIFNNNLAPRRRNDPWWMRDEEKNNPKLLPEYKPWWLDSNQLVDESWKVNDLKAEANRRGIAEINGLKKAELIQLLLVSTQANSLTDDNFTNPSYYKSDKVKPTCYPDVYESNYEQIRSDMSLK